jgi:hypothetical protein
MTHNRPFASLLLCLFAPPLALAQVLTAPTPLGEPPTTVYRQMTPDGHIVYSDKAQQGARIDHALTVAPPDKGNLWSVEGGERPVIAPQVIPTPVKQVSSIPAPGQQKTFAEATSDVIRAEMLLDDARKKREAGREPLPGELQDSAYVQRQHRLARDVARAEATLERTVAERNALRKKR